MNKHTGKQLDILNHDLQQIQEEMMGKARAIETRLSVIKMLEECEVNGHHWHLNGQPQSNLFCIEGHVELSCAKCGCLVRSDFKQIYFTVGMIEHADGSGRVSVEEFINGREEE